MELERSKEKFAEQGLGVTAVSYDSRELLRNFADRIGITYPLLSDADSSIIRAFGILNTNIEEDHEWHGIPFPGTYIVDENGKVVEKYFDEDYRERTTADSILVRDYGAGGGTGSDFRTDHLSARAYPAQDSARPGNRVTLILDIELPDRMHLYAPGAGSYRPVAFIIHENPHVKVHEAELPPHEVLHLDVIKETVPVYRDRLRVTRDVALSARLREPALELDATFEYQACDDKICYPPAKVPLKFTIRVERHDTQRVPEHLRKSGTRP